MYSERDISLNSWHKNAFDWLKSCKINQIYLRENKNVKLPCNYQVLDFIKKDHL